MHLCISIGTDCAYTVHVNIFAFKHTPVTLEETTVRFFHTQCFCASVCDCCTMYKCHVLLLFPDCTPGYWTLVCSWWSGPAHQWRSVCVCVRFDDGSCNCWIKSADLSGCVHCVLVSGSQPENKVIYRPRRECKHIHYSDRERARESAIKRGIYGEKGRRAVQSSMHPGIHRLSLKMSVSLKNAFGRLGKNRQ